MRRRLQPGPLRDQGDGADVGHLHHQQGQSLAGDRSDKTTLIYLFAIFAFWRNTVPVPDIRKGCVSADLSAGTVGSVLFVLRPTFCYILGKIKTGLSNIDASLMSLEVRLFENCVPIFCC